MAKDKKQYTLSVEAMNKVLRGGKKDLTPSKLLAAIVKYFGGPDGLAKELFELYGRSDSVMAKQRLMSSIMDMFKHQTVAMRGSASDESELSDEDLEQAIRHGLSKIAAGEVAAPEEESGEQQPDEQ